MNEVEVYTAAGGAVQVQAGAAPTIENAMLTLANVQKFVSSRMVEGTDYGTIPGTKKPTLYKPGAEKIAMLFNCRDEYDIATTELGNGHVEHVITTRLVHRLSGIVMATGVGSCSTMESKYRYRSGEGESTGQEVPKRYWDLKKAKQFREAESVIGKGMQTRKIDGTWFICKPSENRIENPDIYDCRNTVLKMGKKRSKVDAAINLGCVGDRFTADLEEGHVRGSDDDYAGNVEEEYQPPDNRSTSDKIRDRRDQEDAERRAAVNEQFKPKERAPRPWSVGEYEQWRDAWVNSGNDAWRARCGAKFERLPEKYREPFSKFMIQGHLAKFLADLVPARDGLVKEAFDEVAKALAFEMVAHQEEFDAELQVYTTEIVPRRLKEEMQKVKEKADAKAAKEAAKPEPIEAEVVTEEDNQASGPGEY